MTVRVAVVGEYEPDRETHPATTAAVGHAAASLGVAAAVQWVSTDAVAGAPEELRDYDGIWIAPGSPYRSLEGALQAIALSRMAGIPLLGTCAGFQHIVLEYARNVLALGEAQHAEYEPDAGTLFVTPLSCSLAGQSFTVCLADESLARAAYGTGEATERYYCNFGLNPDHHDELEAAGLRVSGTDTDGEARIVELRGHPFFVGTLFVPQVASAPGRPHPLVTAFVSAAWRASAGRRRRASSGSPFEASVGFSRAVRVGERVLVSGTAPVWPDGSCPGDVALQARRCFEIVGAALADVGANLADVVRTRMFLTSAADAEAVGAVHAELFVATRPAATMVVVAGLLDPRWKVEVEAEAVTDG